MTFMEQFTHNFLLDFASRPPPHPFRVSRLITVDYLCYLVALFIFYLYSTMDVDSIFQGLNYKWGSCLPRRAPRLLPLQRTIGGKQLICPQNNMIMVTFQNKRFEWCWNFHSSPDYSRQPRRDAVWKRINWIANLFSPENRTIALEKFHCHHQT